MKTIDIIRDQRPVFGSCYRLLRFFQIGLAATLLGLSSVTYALEVGNVTIHGFFTAAATQSDSPGLYLDATTDDLSFEEDSIYGLQFGTSITEDITIEAQLLAGGTNTRGDFDVRVDWAFVAYEMNENLTLRAGRIRFPALLASEYVEVGYSYPWIRPPEMYPGMPVNAVFGVGATVSYELGPITLSIEPLVGSFTDVFSVGPADVTVRLQNIKGGNIDIGNEFFSIRASVIEFDSTFSPASVALAIGVTGVVGNKHTSFGGKLDWNNIVLYAETAEFAFENAPFNDQEDTYVTLGYRIGNFMPHITIEESTSKATLFVPETTHDATTLGLRYDLGPQAALKVERYTREVDGLDDLNVYSVALDYVF